MAILIVAVIFITATTAAPISTRCIELLNSTGPYDYCNRATNTSQVDDSLNNLILTANNVTNTFVHICGKKENKEVSTCRCMSYEGSVCIQYCVVDLLICLYLFQA